MRVFITGASGFIGKALVKELLANGHTVLGLARSDASAETLTSLGADVQRGDLTDLDALKAGAAASDGVIHLAFHFDLSNFRASVDMDKNAIQAMADALEGSNRPLITTCGTLVLTHGRLGTEDDVHDLSTTPLAIRGESEELAKSLASKGIRTAVVRLAAVVHGDDDKIFIPKLIAMAREKGVSAYIQDIQNRWPATHVLDAAVAYRLALEKAPAGSMLHVVAEEGVRLKDIATAIGEKLGVPVVSISEKKAGEHFGWLGEVIKVDNLASSAKTREVLGWEPKQWGLVEDLRHGKYF